MRRLLIVFLLILLTLRTAQTQSGTVSLFGSTTPGDVDSGDSSAVNLGMRWKSSVDGNVVGVRFYKATLNVGTHIGYLWTNDGSLLASITFTGETSTGWQEATFASPIAVTANTVYVIGYYAPNAHYSRDLLFFASDYTNGVLTGTANTSDAHNGVFIYGAAGTFPTDYAGNYVPELAEANYYVDVLFEPGESEATDTPTPTSTPTSGPSPTPTATLSPTPNTIVYSTVIAPGDESGQDVAFRYEITAGEAANALLLFALVVIGLLRFVYELRMGAR